MRDARRRRIERVKRGRKMQERGVARCGATDDYDGDDSRRTQI